MKGRSLLGGVEKGETARRSVGESAKMREKLISAAGVSAKARDYITDDDINEKLAGIIEGIPEARGKHFREELFYRYLLTKGASLDGEMRNYAGAEAGRLLVAALLAALEVKHDPLVSFKDNNDAEKLPEAKSIAESKKVQKIEWHNRLLLFDKKPGLVRKNVDMILLDASSRRGERILLTERACYLACGELKGGIDPAGADEHWKTARAALDRVAAVLLPNSGSPPSSSSARPSKTSMAEEIFDWLQGGKLAHAANLTVQRQVDDLASWLANL